MSAKVKLIKRVKADEPMPVATKRNPTQQQSNQEIVGVIKSWIEDLKLRNASTREAALLLLK